MTIRARSLVNNSISSILSSALLIFSTVLIPAILVRAITRADYDLLSLILAALPLLSIVPQSLRTAAASQLAIAYGRVHQWTATRIYWRFSMIVGLGLLATSIAGTEFYVHSAGNYQNQTSILRFGLYCISGHALGLIAIGLFSGPAAARRDFLPENFAKLWPGLFHLAGLTMVWICAPRVPLMWICLIFLTSSWSAALILGSRLWRSIYTGPDRKAPSGHDEVAALFWSGLRGTTWWNVTAYLATSSAILIVSLQHPASIVPFSVASSFLGITSAGLIAVASPVSGYAVGLVGRGRAERRRFFLMVNTLFQIYIAITALVVLLLPQQLFILWLQPQLADEVRHFCSLLLPAYALRLLTMAFTVFVMSAGRQETIWLSPLVEAVMSVIGCLILGNVIGITGIPIALTISAATRLLLTLLHDERRNVEALDIRAGDTMLSAWRLWGAK